MNFSELSQDYDIESFFNLSPDLICIAGFDGYFKKINPAVCSTLGYSESELLSIPINFFVYSEDRLATIQSRETVKNGIHLLDFENRYVSKKGEIIWLSWTSIPVPNEETVFAIAKNITKRKIREGRHLDEHEGYIAKKKANDYNHESSSPKVTTINSTIQQWKKNYSAADKMWLTEFENIVRINAGKNPVSIPFLCSALAISDRQLYRIIKRITGDTPNKLIKMLLMQKAWESIEAGQYRTLSELSYSVGIKTPNHFKKMFREVFEKDVSELL